MSLLDWIALGLFALVWLGYEPILLRVTQKSGAIHADMEMLRAVWMRRLARREGGGLVDANLLGHTINSASFFASANLILIAAVAGALFGGGMKLNSVLTLGGVVHAGPPPFVELRLALITACLTRGFLDFIWSIRQLNYCLALIGAAPEDADEPRFTAFADACAEVLNPALSAFSHGVRAYYFALAAAAWLLGPIALLIATGSAFALLIWRQARSPAARGIRHARAALEDRAGG